MIDKTYPLVLNTESIKTIFKVLFGSLFMALVAQFKITLWFTPVPISLQTAGVLLIGSLFSPRIALSILLTYLGEGAMGFPVFAGAERGIAHLIGSTAGYLWSFPLVAYMIAKVRSSLENPLHHFILLCFGSFLMLTCGTLWLACLIGLQSAFTLGFYPFIPGNILKISTVFSTLYLTKGLCSFIKKN
jgi:biotin transport system substrate-specific component